MNDKAFIQAIRDEPDDDAPRLVYADFLEDQGRSERAEFIRVQCELTRGVRDRGRSLELLRRLRELVRRHREEWLGNLARWVPHVIFERGFVDRIVVRGNIFLDHAGAMLATHPIARVVLYGPAESWTMHDLAACPELAQLYGLDLRDNGLGDSGAVALASSPYLSRLAELVLSNNGLGITGLRALVATAQLRGLRTLVLAHNHLGDGGVEALAWSPNLPRLARLDLSSNDVTDRGAEMLAESPYLGRLTALRLAHNRLTQAGVERLASSPLLAGLTILDVLGSGIDHRTRANLQRQFGSRLLC
jgi:uncharacterized protein (TIGR02996 family)